MRRHQQADFGNTRLGEEGEPVQKQSGSSGGSGGQGEMCSQQACGGMAQAASAAVGALGPVGKKISNDQLAAMASDKSAEGQRQYQAALAHNAEVDKQNGERKGIIDQFVKDAIGGNITREQVMLGDAAKAEYEKFVAKNGEQVRYMTLGEVLTKYPEDSRVMVQSLAAVFPGLRGRSFEEIISLIPDAMKSMTMMDLESVVPDSSWLGAKTSTGQSIAGGTMAIGGLAIAALGLAAVFFMKKGGSSAPRT